jgi:hypothetical protein
MMKTRLLTAIYWIVGLMIGLGAFGHGFSGIKPVRAALDTVTLPPDVRGVIWIVWYFVSGCMLTFAVLIIWAWFAARRGYPSALAVPIVIALFWMATGIAAYAYQHNPFWLLFLAEGTGLLAASLGLRGAPAEMGRVR